MKGGVFWSLEVYVPLGEYKVCVCRVKATVALSLVPPHLCERTGRYMESLAVIQAVV